MRIFFASDHHFFHANIIKYCKRPFSDVSHMNEEMTLRWNKTVSSDDVLIYCGDLTAGLGDRSEELRLLIGDLNGRKILVRGNHDHKPDAWYLEAGFEKVVGHFNFGGVLAVHYCLEEAIARGLDINAIGTVEHVVHGHTHATEVPNHENHYNVAMDRNNYTPVDYKVAVPERLQTHFHDSVVSFCNMKASCL